MTKHSRTFVLPTLALATILALAACGGSEPASSIPGMSSSSSGSAAATGTPAAGEHNKADVAFATGMIPHHRQAVEMADLAATRAGSAGVKDLAARIKAAQGPEIATMSGWLTGWGAAVPSNSGMAGMDDMGSGSDMGMMSEDDMRMLDQASGTAFDKAFLTGMTTHHQGAVAMAKTELSDGSNAQAKALAQDIITSQSKEIAEMKQLLGSAG